MIPFAPQANPLESVFIGLKSEKRNMLFRKELSENRRNFLKAA